jgi:hypothetical protein
VYRSPVSEIRLRRLSRALRAATAAATAGKVDPANLRVLCECVRDARATCFYEDRLWSFHGPSPRRFRRTMEDAKQTVRCAEIALVALEP